MKEKFEDAFDDVKEIVGPILGFFLGCLIIMLCWNGTMPELFDAPHITYLDSMVLRVLCCLLFGRLKTD